MSCLCSCCAASTCGLCSSVATGISRRSARLAYCALFGIALIISWIFREVAAPLLEKIPCEFASILQHCLHTFAIEIPLLFTYNYSICSGIKALIPIIHYLAIGFA